MAIKDVTGCVAAYEADVAYNTGTTQATQFQTVQTLPNAFGTSLGYGDFLAYAACNRPVWMIDPSDGLPFLRFGLYYGRSPWDTTDGVYLRKFMTAQIVTASAPGGNTFSSRTAYAILARITAIKTGSSGADGYLVNYHKKDGTGTDWYTQIKKDFTINRNGNVPSPVIPISMGWSWYTDRGGFAGAEGGRDMSRDQRSFVEDTTSAGTAGRDQINLGFFDADVGTATIAADGVTLTKTGAFANYEFTAGDQIRIISGTNVTAGVYTIASRTSDDEIVLSADCTTDASSHADVRFLGFSPSNSLFFDLRVAWFGQANGARVPAASLTSVISASDTKWGSTVTKTRQYARIANSLDIQPVGKTVYDASETVACQLSRRLPNYFEIIADALPGRRIASSTDPMSDTYTNTILALKDATMTRYVELDCGINDFLNRDVRAATVKAELDTVVAAVKAGGDIPIRSTITDARGGVLASVTNPTFATDRLAYNALLVADGRSDLNDVAAIAQIGPRYSSCNGAVFNPAEATFATVGGGTHDLAFPGKSQRAEGSARTVLALAGLPVSASWEHVRTESNGTRWGRWGE